MVRFIVFLLIFIVSPHSSQASSFYSCKVFAEIQEINKTDNSISIRVFDSVVGGGQAGPTGKACPKTQKGQILDIILDPLPKNKGIVLLNYNYFDGKSPKGLIVSEKWSVYSYANK